MPPEIFTPDEIRAVAAQNPLRQYPGVRKGRDRLLPFAQPQIRTDLRFPEGATFFVVGDCVGRNFEKGLAKAGRQFLSSPSDLDLPGSTKEQFNRYNISNLDVSANEVTWAIDPNAPSPDDALIQVGDEWVDMQIHWTFAHDKKQAQAYRSIYNTSYTGIAEADVIILISNNIEQWFDRQTGLYLNGMPTTKMSTLYPGRFEFHRLDVEACEQSYRRTIDIVLAHTKVDPIILLTVTPGPEPLVYGQNDAMVEQFLAKSHQRIAAEHVCKEYGRVEYLPSLEFALLSDFKYTYNAASLNHCTQGLINRIIAEMLLRYEGDTPGYQAIRAIGQAEALISADEHEAAVALVEEAMEAGAPHSFDLDFQYVRALSQSGHQAKAASWLVARMGVVKDEYKVETFQLASNLVQSYGTKAEINAFLAHAEDIEIDDETRHALETAMEKRAERKQVSKEASAVESIVELFKANDYDEVAKQCQAMLDNPKTTADAMDRIMPLLVRSLIQADRYQELMECLCDLVVSRASLDQRWVNLLVQIAVSQADLDMTDRILALSDKFDKKNGLNALERRRAALIEETVDAPGQ